MTGKMKALLCTFVRGVDVNVYAQMAQLIGKREATNAARTVLALLRAGMLQHAKGGGLELSGKGKTEGAKIRERDDARILGLGGRPR